MATVGELQNWIKNQGLSVNSDTLEQARTAFSNPSTTSAPVSSSSSNYNINSRGEDINPYKSSTPAPAQGTVLAPATDQTTQKTQEQPKTEQQKTPEIKITAPTSGQLLTPAQLAAGTGLKESDIARTSGLNIYKRDLAKEQAALGDYIAKYGQPKTDADWRKFHDIVYEPKNVSLDSLAGGDITKIDSSITETTPSTVEIKEPTEAKSIFEDMAVDFTQNRQVEFDALEKKRAETLAEINKVNEELKKRMTEYDATTARAKQIESDLDKSWKIANIESEWKRQQELLNGMQGLMTVINQTTPDGTVPVSILSRQNAGKFAGMHSMFEASKGYTTNAVNNIVTYYQEKRLANQNTAAQIGNMIDLFENRRISLTKDEKDLFDKQIEVLQKQDEENFAKEKAITDFIMENPNAYSIANINPEDDFNTIVSKIGKAKFTVDAFNDLLKEYPDSGITYNMTFDEMKSKIESSPLYKAKLDASKAKNEPTNTEVQALRSEYINKGIYITSDDARAIMDGTKTADAIYGEGFGQTIQNTFLNKVLANETNPSIRESMVYSMTNLMKSGDVRATVEWMNGQILAKLTGTDLSDYKEATNIVDGFDDTLKTLNGMTDKQKKAINTWWLKNTKPLTDITQQDLPKEVLSVLSSLNLTWGTVRNSLFGASLTENEQKESGLILNNTQSIDNIIAQSTKLKDTYKRRANRILSNNGAIISNDLGKFSDFYKNPSGKQLIDDYVKTHPNANVDEIVKYINSEASKIKTNEVGKLSKKYESSGRSDAIGFDTTGGKSYGQYQMSTKSGNAQAFATKYYQKEFGKLVAGTDAFDKKWKELSKRPDFAINEQRYINDTHYQPALSIVNKKLGTSGELNPVLKDVLWSLSVQHGVNGGANIFINAAKKLAGENKLTPENLVNEIYNERSKVDIYFKSSTDSVKNSVYKRFQQERKDALAMLNSKV